MRPHVDDDTLARVRHEHRTWEGGRPSAWRAVNAASATLLRLWRSRRLMVWAALLLLARVAYAHSGLARWLHQAAQALGLPFHR